MIERLFNNLAPSLNRDPLPASAIQINSNTPITIVVKDGFIQFGNFESYSLSSYTISGLTQKMNTFAGIQASVIEYGSLSALALIDGTFTISTGALQVFTSPLWQFGMSLSKELKKVEDQSNSAFFQANPRTSSGIWLDSLGDLYGVTRESGEPDTLYALRVFNFSLAPRVNSVAIQKILTDLGYTVKITNTTPAPSFQVTVTLPLNPPSGFIYSVGQLSDLVNLLKADGVASKVLIDGQYSDSIKIQESFTSTIRTTAPKYNSGVKWGEFTWS